MEQKITVQEYNDWLLARIPDEYNIEQIDNCIMFKAEGYKASVRFHPEQIIEMNITDQADDPKFFLHFQLDSREHAEELSEQMIEAFEKLKNRKGLRVLLTCTSGMTTSYFAEQLTQTAEVLSLDYSFDATAFTSLYAKADSYDVVLLAPQVGYHYKKTKEILSDKLVIKMPAGIFGTYNTGEMIDLIKDELEKKKEEEKAKNEPLPITVEDNDYRIMILGLISQKGSNRCAYRIYDHGKIVLDDEIIKPSINLRDIDDLMDYIAVTQKDIDVIGIAIPGITYKGIVTNDAYDFDNQNLGRHISERCDIHTFVLNDANALALGYSTFHKECTDMAFVFQPRGRVRAGIGLIINGQLRRGYKHNAGEIGTMQTRFCPEDVNPDDPEDAMKLVSIALQGCISVLAPEKIVLYSELTPDTEEIRKELEQYIDEEFIPEIIRTPHLKSYMLHGTMVRCIAILDKHKNDPDYFSFLEN